MGFNASFISAHMPAEELAYIMGLAVTGFVDEAPDGEQFWAVRVKDACSILWAENELFGLQNEARIRAISKRTLVLNCIVQEHSMNSAVIAYEAGRRVWAVHWNGRSGKIDDNLRKEGLLPSSFDEVFARQKLAQLKNPGTDVLFDVPLILAEEICGFRHDRWFEKTEVDVFRTLSVVDMPKIRMPKFPSLWRKFR